MLIVEPQGVIKHWLCEQIGYIPTAEFICIGQYDEQRKDLTGAVGYDGWSENMVEIHVASVPGAYWFTKELLYKSFHFPFVVHGRNIVASKVSSSNEAAVNFNRKLGFKEQCRIKGGSSSGDLIIFTMYRAECKWLDMDLRFKEAA
ncbi:MAG: hypothetical protein DRI24_01765 [Deltaproteobacteria bacterium]|nr:MAG: hypothetical protein DRI24_01765 [Deltaproteobacteria bacterium]